MINLIQNTIGTLGRRVTSSPSFVGLLNTYSGAAIAYSLRQLDSTYTGSAIRVRRSSDNVEQDIGFANNILDTASLLTFVGSGDGFVTTWYDQSGNAGNATKSTAADQPKIVSSGSVILDNGLPTVEFNGISSWLDITQLTINNYSLYVAASVSDMSDNRTLIGKYTSDYIYIASGGSILKTNPGGKFYNFNAVIDTQYLLSANRDVSNNITTRKDGATLTSSYQSSTTTYFRRIGQANGLWYYAGNISEMVLYPSDKSSDRTGIEGDINTYYSIY